MIEFSHEGYGNALLYFWSLWHVTGVMIDISLISETEQMFMYSLGICVS